VEEAKGVGEKARERRGGESLAYNGHFSLITAKGGSEGASKEATAAATFVVVVGLFQNFGPPLRLP